MELVLNHRKRVLLTDRLTKTIANGGEVGDMILDFFTLFMVTIYCSFTQVYTWLIINK